MFPEFIHLTNSDERDREKLQLFMFNPIIYKSAKTSRITQNRQTDRVAVPVVEDSRGQKCQRNKIIPENINQML